MTGFIPVTVFSLQTTTTSILVTVLRRSSASTTASILRERILFQSPEDPNPTAPSQIDFPLLVSSAKVEQISQCLVSSVQEPSPRTSLSFEIPSVPPLWIPPTFIISPIQTKIPSACLNLSTIHQVLPTSKFHHRLRASTPS